MNFIRVTFICGDCGESTDILFESGNGINEVFERIECKICKEIKPIGVGDMGYRTDMPDPDYSPWQAQFIRINLNDAICDSCTEKHKIFIDHSSMITDCFSCGGKHSMRVSTIKQGEENSLQILLKNLMKNDNRRI